MFDNPVVVQGDVIGNEIQDQGEPLGGKGRAGPVEALGTPEALIGRVIPDAVGGPGYVVGGEVGKRLAAFLEERGRCPCDSRAGRAALPDTHQPDGLEPEGGDGFPLLRRDIRQRDGTPVPAAQFTADPVTQVFDPAGTNVTFTNTTNEGTWDWLWRFGDNTTSVERDPVHQYGDVGTYYITLIAGNGICSDSITRFITIVPPAPVAIFDPVESGCAPLELSFNNTSLNTEVPGTTYKWDFGDGTSSNDAEPLHQYTTAGVYKVTLTVTDDKGDTGQDVLYVTAKESQSQSPIKGVPGFELPAVLGGSAVAYYLISKRKRK